MQRTAGERAASLVACSAEMSVEYWESHWAVQSELLLAVQRAVQTAAWRADDLAQRSADSKVGLKAWWWAVLMAEWWVWCWAARMALQMAD